MYSLSLPNASFTFDISHLQYIKIFFSFSLCFIILVEYIDTTPEASTTSDTSSAPTVTTTPTLSCPCNCADLKNRNSLIRPHV